MVLLALSFPLLVCAFLLVMEALEAAVLPARAAPVPAPTTAPTGTGGEGALGVVPTLPLPREPLPVPDGTATT